MITRHTVRRYAQAKEPKGKAARTGANTTDGLCECGCGERAPIAKKTYVAVGQVMGQPVRFIYGHFRRMATQAAIKEHKSRWQRQAPGIPYGFCQCGCGASAPIASQSNTRNGWIKGQPVRFVRGHHWGDRGPDYVEENRGYATPCWVWQHHISTNGYARMNIAGRSVGIHRLNYERKHGRVPPGKDLDHLCAPYGGPRHCVNPDHVEPVTRAENLRRGRGVKLSEREVLEIRRRFIDEGEPHDHLTREFGISRNSLWAIVSGKSWADVGGSRYAPGVGRGPKRKKRSRNAS